LNCSHKSNWWSNVLHLAKGAIINNLNWAGAPGTNLAGAVVNFVWLLLFVWGVLRLCVFVSEFVCVEFMCGVCVCLESVSGLAFECWRSHC
jgi:hypothetical protein